MTRRNLRAALLYFALVMGTGFAFGCVRVLLLVPRIGERYAELVEMPFMLLAIVVAARYVVRRFDLSPRLGIRLQSRGRCARPVCGGRAYAVNGASRPLGHDIHREPRSGVRLGLSGDADGVCVDAGHPCIPQVASRRTTEMT
jgi:hypothetical protein